MDPSNIAFSVANGDSSILLILIGVGIFALTWYCYDQAKKFITTKKKRFF